MLTASLNETPLIWRQSMSLPDYQRKGALSAAIGSFASVDTNGINVSVPQIVAAAGSNSQAAATAITKSRVVVTTVSATSRAVRLPTAATGREVEVYNAAATAVKVYPATNDKIGAASTNAAGTAIAAGKPVKYIAQDATTWRTFIGA
jgi:hypothetical protein